jgi:hypothetical protein
MYQMNIDFARLMEKVKERFDIDDEVLAQCCLDWVRQNGDWRSDRDKTLFHKTRALQLEGKYKEADELRHVETDGRGKKPSEEPTEIAPMKKERAKDVEEDKEQKQ